MGSGEWGLSTPNKYCGSENTGRIEGREISLPLLAEFLGEIDLKPLEVYSRHDLAQATTLGSACGPEWQQQHHPIRLHVRKASSQALSSPRPTGSESAFDSDPR